MFNKASVSFLLLIILSSIGTHVHASENLPRKAFMGIGGQPAEGGVGLQVTVLLDNATGDLAGLQRGDVIQAINNQPVASMQQLIVSMESLHAGDAVRFDLIRDNHELSLTTQATQRPQEVSDKFLIDYGQVEYAGERLRSIVYRPSGVESAPAVFFIQGFGCGSIDYGVTPKQTVAQLARAYAEHGFAVFRMEKPGVGDSVGQLDCVSIDYLTEVDVFAAGLQTLRDLPGIDKDNIFLFGHSLGATTAPILAQQQSTRGIIAFGSVAKPWDEYLIDVFREQRLRTGDDPLELNQRAALAKSFLHDLIVEKMSWEQLAARHSVALSAGLFGNSPNLLFERDYRFLATLGAVDLFPAWAAYQQPVLAIYGSYDIQAISAEGAQTTAKIVNAYHPGNATVLLMDQTEHGFARYPGSFEEYLAELNSGRWTGARMAELYDPRVHQETIQWMRAVLSVSQG